MAVERSLLRSRSLPALAASLLVLVSLAGCLSWGAAGSKPARLPGTRVALPKGDLAAEAWLPDGYLYVLRQPPNLDVRTEIWRARLGEPPRRVDLPTSLDGCDWVDYLLPRALPDGRLGLARFCQAPTSEQTHIDLVAYDPKTGRLEVLAPMGHYNPTGVTWRHDLSGGYVAHGSGICDGIAPLTRQGPGAFPGPVTLDGHTWSLDADFRRSGAEDCRDDGRAFSPLLTPDERRLVFLAVPQAQGHSGQARLDFPASIWIQDLPDGTPRVLARDFARVSGTAMMPDGRSMVVSGRRGAQSGVWLLELATGKLRRVADVAFYSLAVSPDGHQLAGLYNPGRYEEFKAELRVLTLPAGS
jgi:hypothetical protein